MLNIRALLTAALLLSLPVLALAMGDSPPPAPNQKPSGPLTLEIAALPPVSGMPGGSIHLGVTVRSMGASGDIEVRLKLTGGALLVQGDERWSGTIADGGELSRSIIVQPGKASALIAEAGIKDAHSGKFKAHARYSMGDEQGPAPKEGRTGRDSTGREVEEHPAR